MKRLPSLLWGAAGGRDDEESAVADAWRQRVGGLVELPGLVAQLGADPHAVLKDAGLPVDALHSASHSIPFVAIERLLHAACRRTGCEWIGLMAGAAWRIHHLGLPGELLRHSSTLGEALRTFVVHQHLNSDGALFHVREHDDVVDFGYALFHPDVVDGTQIVDGALAAELSVLRELCGSDWTPTAVFLPHAPPASIRPFRDLFRVNPHFDAEFAALRFPSSMMSRRLPGADPKRRHAAEQRALAANDANLLQRTYRAVRLLLLDNRHTAEDIARMLSVHRRTLNRRLRAQGTTFQEVLDRVRFDAARQLLSATELPLDDVAAALGYSTLSSFMRAFQRWSGMAPGQWRRAGLRSRTPPRSRRAPG